ncbi:unnamed protein product [Caenorhabditis nigoni]
MDPSPGLVDLPKEVKENLLKWCDYSSVIALGKTCKTWHDFIRAPDHNLPILAITLKCRENSHGMQVMSTVPFEGIMELNYVTLEYKQDGETSNVTRCQDANWENPRTTLVANEDCRKLLKEDLKVLKQLLGNSRLMTFEVDCDDVSNVRCLRELGERYHELCNIVSGVWGNQMIEANCLKMKFHLEIYADRILRTFAPGILRRIILSPIEVGGFDFYARKPLSLHETSRMAQWIGAKEILFPDFKTKPYPEKIIHLEWVYVSWLCFKPAHLVKLMEEFILLKSTSKDFTIWSDHIEISKYSFSILYGESVELQCSPGTHIWYFDTPSPDFVVEFTLVEGSNVSFKIIMDVEMKEGATIRDFNRLDWI